MFSDPIEGPHQMWIIKRNGITCLDLHALACIIVIRIPSLELLYTVRSVRKTSGIYTPNCLRFLAAIPSVGHC